MTHDEHARHPHRGARACRPATARWPSSASSTSASTPARSSRSSARTAPARRRRCSPSPASSRPWRARSGSSASRPRSPMHVRCRNGLGYVTEERSVIMDMSVADNLKLARCHPRRRSTTSRRSKRSWTAAPGCARAASSRCCRWPGRSGASRRCCSPTSCRSAWRRSSSPTCSRRRDRAGQGAGRPRCCRSATDDEWRWVLDVNVIGVRSGGPRLRADAAPAESGRLAFTDLVVGPRPRRPSRARTRRASSRCGVWRRPPPRLDTKQWDQMRGGDFTDEVVMDTTALEASGVVTGADEFMAFRPTTTTSATSSPCTTGTPRDRGDVARHRRRDLGAAGPRDLAERHAPVEGYVTTTTATYAKVDGRVAYRARRPLTRLHMDFSASADGLRASPPCPSSSVSGSTSATRRSRAPPWPTATRPRSTWPSGATVSAASRSRSPSTTAHRMATCPARSPWWRRWPLARRTSGSWWPR